ncbi:NO-inducible flavohemoprotein [Telmatospirillum sp. J64-1]|uniref:NO-inducible flavohemoprotein n=1 Tax=Telmatospirillum sp. J64-1 TaxID=2502183 RepID=UPI00115DE332|nr:NO-inducible flavohemoprotein [Telmatospirillum sp. J64-1]
MLSPHHRTIVKSTAPVLAEHGLAITRHFYQRLFRKHPELKNIFNQAHQVVGDQPRALADAVHAYAANIDQPHVLSAAIRRITHKHASLNIQPAQYDIVGENLLAAIREVLGDAVTDEVIAAWTAAYDQLAAILMAAESELHRKAAEGLGGRQDWRSFTIRRIRPESCEITSFYLVPADGGPVPAFKPGQYVSVRVFVPSLGLIQPRQYSLSDAPNGRYLRISVKREGRRGSHIPVGMVSTLLHDDFDEGDEIELSPPFGDFTLHEDRDTPVILISGGVGITPMISMLNALTGSGSRREVVFVHGARDSSVQAMRQRVRQAARDHANVTALLFLEKIAEGDRAGEEYDVIGQVDLEAVKDHVLRPQADYYLCGPLPFLRLQRDQLLAMGVGADRIHYEVFGSDILGTPKAA